MAKIAGSVAIKVVVVYVRELKVRIDAEPIATIRPPHVNISTNVEGERPHLQYWLYIRWLYLAGINGKCIIGS